MTCYDFDIAFLGSRYTDEDQFGSTYRWRDGRPAHDAQLRDDVVHAMREAFGARFGLFGRGWGEGVEEVPRARAHEVYQRSKVGLSVSLDNKLECYTSDRLFRILGCGALLLVKRFPGMGILGLKHDENCLVFDTPAQAVEMVRFACGYGGREPGVSEVVRGRIAAAGAVLARERHTWGARVRELTAYVDAVRAARRGP